MPGQRLQDDLAKTKRTFSISKQILVPRTRYFHFPSTFEYKDQAENLLWKEEDDLNLLKRIAKVKRESRINRDNSEDAVTWNVFRFLEKENLLSRYLLTLFKNRNGKHRNHVWSYSQSEKNVWSELVRGRKEFELVPAKVQSRT